MGWSGDFSKILRTAVNFIAHPLKMREHLRKDHSLCAGQSNTSKGIYACFHILSRGVKAFKPSSKTCHPTPAVQLRLVFSSLRARKLERFSYEWPTDAADRGG